MTRIKFRALTLLRPDAPKARQIVAPIAKRYAYVHEAVAAAVRRRFLMLTVESTYPEGDINGFELDLKGGTKEQRDKAMAFAKRFAEGWVQRPTK